MFCMFHAIWQPFKRDIYHLLPSNNHQMESWWDKMRLVDHWVSTCGIYSDLWNVWLPLLILSWSLAIYSNGINQHQACVHRTKAQYNRSNRILTEMLSWPLYQDLLSNDCINAIENFQCFMTNKEQYLAFHVRKKMSMSLDAMTTSPVESMNSSIKNGIGVTSNSNTRWIGRWLCIINEFIE